MAKVRSVKVFGLLDEFDHSFTFRDQWEFVILYGPNGVGKTRLLQLVHAAVTLNWPQLARVIFRQITVEFDEGSILDIQRSEYEVEDATRSNFFVALTRDGKTYEGVREDRARRTPRLEWIARNSPWTQIGEDLWEDERDGEVITTDELLDRYSRRDAVDQMSLFEENIPIEINAFCEGNSSHFIQTQRLTTIPRIRRNSSPTARSRSSRETVSEYAEDMKMRLRGALAANSRTTQQLDRSFPERIFSGKTPDDLRDDTIRTKYEEQNSLRKRLARYSLITAQPDLPLPQRELAVWERRVLWTYLVDTDQKLATFEKLLEKVSLFEEIINGRFLRKEIRIDVEEGLRVVSIPSLKPLAPEHLSSGEQHELILIYDLLFNVEPGSLVLIDEPEISLHVGWQKRFLDDIAEISRLSPVRFVIATHSPQIIHKWWDRTVQLGPVEEL